MKNIEELNILVVDDSTTMIRILSNTLTRLGAVNIDTALNGKEAHSKWSSKHYDLILTDWNMPEMNGYDLVLNIRKVDSDVYIIMVTTESGKPEVIKALKAGVNNYITKPFTPATLREKLQIILK